MPEQYFQRSSNQEAPAFEGVEFIELATANPNVLDQLLTSLGFSAQARHRSKDVTLYRQGEINLVVNSSQGSFAAEYASPQGSAICALALRTVNATRAYQNLLGRGAWESTTTAGAMELNIPAIESIGGSQIYLIDRYADGISIYDIDFKTIPDAPADAGLLDRICSLSLTMEPERRAPWHDFFTQLFGFESRDEHSIRLDRHLRLELETDGRPDLTDERISAIRFTARDLDAAGQHVRQQGLKLRPLPDDDGFEVIAPLADLAIRILISR